MNILKPQKIHFKELTDIKLKDIQGIEKVEYSNFLDEECNELKIHDIEFEYCKFRNIQMQNGELEKITFRDIIFDWRKSEIEMN